MDRFQILVVEDNDKKRNAIVSELNNLGVLTEDVHLASTAVEARKKLASTSFEVMLLDLILPLRSDTHPTAETGLELLRQIVLDGDLPAPRNIVGVTADRTALKDSEEEFRDLTKQIIFYEIGASEWKRSLKHLFDFVRNSISSSRNYNIDICYITALRDPELTAVLDLPYIWSPEESLTNGLLVRRGTGEINGRPINVVCAHSNKMGMVSAALLTRLLIEKFHPRVALMTGVCGGIGDTVDLGDLVIAERSWDWQCGKWTAESAFESAPDQEAANGELAALARSLDGIITELYSKYKGNKPERIPVLRPGPMVSGSAVVATPVLHGLFHQQHRKAIAVDMECYGVYLSTALSPQPSPAVLCLKGISDLANRHKSDNFQPFCSYLSAFAADYVARRYLAMRNG